MASDTTRIVVASFTARPADPHEAERLMLELVGEATGFDDITLLGTSHAGNILRAHLTTRELWEIAEELRYRAADRLAPKNDIDADILMRDIVLNEVRGPVECVASPEHPDTYCLYRYFTVDELWAVMDAVLARSKMDRDTGPKLAQLHQINKLANEVLGFIERAQRPENIGEAGMRANCFRLAEQRCREIIKATIPDFSQAPGA